jgi:hypothetical protein
MGTGRAHEARQLDPASVSATIGGQALPLTHSGSTYTASLAGRADWQLGIVWSAKDFAGNPGTSQMDLYAVDDGDLPAHRARPQRSLRHNTTTPAPSDKAFGLAMTGPSFSQPVRINGTLTSGSMILRVPINQFGTYSGGVIVGSQSSSYSVNVTSSQGTCT